MKILFESRGDAQVVELTCSEEVGLLLEVFAQVAAEQGWQPGEQIGACAMRSHYFAVRVGNEMAGGLQMVLPDAAGNLPCQIVWPEVGQHIACASAHVTILVLQSQFRGRPGIFWPLCVEAWRWCMSRSVEAIVMEATPAMLARYRRVGWPLEVIGDLRVHWGEPCLLCRMSTGDIAGALLMRAFKTSLYRPLVNQAMRSVVRAGCRSEANLPL